MAATYVERVAEVAVRVRPARVLLSVLAAPLYAAGFVAAVAFGLFVWLYAAVQVGWSDARSWRLGADDGSG